MFCTLLLFGYTSLFLEELNNEKPEENWETKSRVWKIEERHVLGMEEFPVELIGKMLSHIAAVDQVVRASGTCRKWREAARNHLLTLRCDCRKRSPVYKNLTSVDLEVSYRDYPANFWSARFVDFDGRRNFSSGDDFLGLGCSEFSSYSEVRIADGAVR